MTLTRKRPIRFPQSRNSVHDSMLVALGMLEGPLEVDRSRIISALDGLRETVTVIEFII